jgi:transposase InsO family protein
MDLRAEFVARLERGERMTDLCREYGIARKTGYKLKERVATCGADGLLDQSRAPKFIPHKTDPALVDVLVAARAKHPTWGPKKIKEMLEREHKRSFPSSSTIGNILVERGMVRRRYRKRWRGDHEAGNLRESSGPNDVWCIDYKGQFRLGNGSYCYPLTFTDHFSRFVLGIEGMSAIDGERAKHESRLLFARYGLPRAMRSDNGAPFASSGLAGLSRLSVYWMRLGIKLERIRPAHPEENGRHERMHRTLKQETTRPARENLLQQQERFDAFIAEFNTERPHEALGMKRPADVYVPSSLVMPEKLPELRYPMHDDVLCVRQSGFIRVNRRNLHLSDALAGELVGIREEEDGSLLVSFMNIDLATIRSGVIEAIQTNRG